MRIPESKIAEVAAAADIVQVISAYVDLKRAGKDYRGLCPFHGDKDPSFYVSPHKGIFHCFGCAQGGSVFNFVMKMENVSFVEAVTILAQRYGVPFVHQEHSRGSRDEKERLLKVVEVAQQYFVQCLRVSDTAWQYLAGREVSPAWIERVGFGFAPDAWDGLRTQLETKGISLRDGMSAGLLKARPTGGYYDSFRSRVTIPINDLNGRHIAFGGRILGEGDPKYLNSSDSPLFRKRAVLYGLDSAREEIRRAGYMIVVEGYFDQISLRIGGLENTVAPLGTALGSDQVRLIKRFSDRVVTIFDGDEAGLKAAKRSLALFLAEGVEPDCVILREHKDPDEAINALGADAFRKVLEASGSLTDFFLDSLADQYDLHSLHGRDLALQECLPVLREIADSKECDYLIERISSRIRVREERVRRVLQSGSRRRHDSSPTGEARKTLFDFPADERNVVRGMLLREGFIDRIAESGVLKDLEDPVLKELALRMVGWRAGGSPFDPRGFVSSLEDHELASTVAAWLQPKDEEDDLRPEVDGDAAIDDSLVRIRLRKLRKRKEEIQEKMKKCDPGAQEFTALAQELWAIGQRLHK